MERKKRTIDLDIRWRVTMEDGSFLYIYGKKFMMKSLIN